MNTPNTAWDRAPTDKELDNFYGSDKSRRVHEEITQTMTQTIRTVGHKALCLQYVKQEANRSPRIAAYPIAEVVTDYGTDPKPLAALLAVIEKSDCPLVAAYRLALAERYADAWADEVEEFTA